MTCKVGGKFHVQVNMSLRPVANKYLEGKMKRTLNQELKELEFAEWKASGKGKRLVRLLFVFGVATCLHAVRVVDNEYHNGASSSSASNNFYMEIDWHNMACLRVCFCSAFAAVN